MILPDEDPKFPPVVPFQSDSQPPPPPPDLNSNN